MAEQEAETSVGEMPVQTKDGYASITTINSTNQSCWVTIYDVGKTQQLDWGCVNPGETRTWWSGNYAWGSFYYVRGELKQSSNCGGNTICDTMIEVNPQNGSKNVVSIHYNPGSNCWWTLDH